MAATNQRLRLLTEAQIQAIYSRPCFTETERQHYFHLNPEELSKLKGLHLASSLHFILQWGYFKAKHLLFDFTFHEAREDVKYIMKYYFSTLKRPKMIPSRNSVSRNNQQILTFFNFKDYSITIRKQIEHKLDQSIRQLNNPSQMFRELFLYMEHKKLVLSSYSTLQDLIGAAIITEEKRIHVLIQQHITKKIKKLIDQLFRIKENEDFYELTLLKRYPKNFNFKIIQAEIEKHKQYYPLHGFAKRFLPRLKISEQNITYYGSLVEHYQVRALQRFSDEKRYFYLLCYAYHRFQLMNDQLIETLIHYVDTYDKEAKEYAKMHAEATNTTIKTQHGEPTKTLIYWYFDPTLSHKVFKEIQGFAQELISKKNMILVGEFLASDQVDKKRYEWEYHDKNFQSMIKNCRPLLKVLDFQASEHNQSLPEGLKFIQALFRNNQSLNDIDMADFPIETIPSHLKTYLIQKEQDKKRKNKVKKSIYLYRYEFYVYDQLNKNIKTSKIYSDNTTQYKNFRDDIKFKKSTKEKKNFLNSLDAPRLNRITEELLCELKTALEYQITATNEHILNGENKYIKIKGTETKRTWTLPYLKKSNEYNNPFYDKLSTTHLIDVLLAVNEECNFIDAFTHIKPHYAKSQQDILGITACLIANATGLGTYKMGDSSDISYNLLNTIEQNFIRLEALRAANDKICTNFSKLPIYIHYHLDNKLHGGADGQKFKTRKDTFNSRYSPKYYGLDKGVAPYSLGVNYNVINCIPDKGAHQHESHFLFKLIQDNTSEIEVERLSTDTEGSNQIMFVLMYFANIDYTPCYRSLRKKTQKIIGFKKPSEYPDDFLIKPSHKANQRLVIEEWSNIQNIIMTFLGKETSVNVITKKLCSHELKDKTKRALWELNDIIQSIYLLRYIDDLELRRFVRAALNRIEAYHALRKHIGETNSASLRGGSDLEVAIWNECARLVANAVMYYNASLLSKLMEIKEEKGDQAAVDFIRHLSPIASQHLNFGGRYEFKNNANIINIKKILELMDKIEIKPEQKRKKHVSTKGKI